MDNLFGIFDPAVSSGLSLNWFGALIILTIPASFWVTFNRISFGLFRASQYLHKEISLSLGAVKTPGLTWLCVSIFFFISVTNYLGLMPYVFTSSRHLRFTLRLAILVWLSLILGSLVLSIYEFLVHLVPMGTPIGLISLMVLIELVRVIIRPITLSVRLAANIVAGHLLISLVCIPALRRYPALTFCIAGARVMMILERAVALIQAYVFSTLRSLYVSDLNATVEL